MIAKSTFKWQKRIAITGFSLLVASCGGGGGGGGNSSSALPRDSFVYAFQEVSNVPTRIHGFRADGRTGALTALAGFPVNTGENGNGNPASQKMTFDAANSRIYVLNSDIINFRNTVSAYSVDTTTGTLAALPFSPIVITTAGIHDCIAVHPSGSPLVVSLSSDLYSFNVTATSAMITNASPVFTGVVSESCAFSRDGNVIYTAGRALNVFAALNVDAATGVLTPVANSPINSGAQSLAAVATDSEGRLFLHSGFPIQAHAFTSNAGTPTPVTQNPFASNLPGAFHGVLHSAGYYLVSSQTQVAVLRIAGSGIATTLSAVAGSPFTSAGGVLALNPAGTHLYIARGLSRNITTFNVNTSSGVLTTPITQPVDTLGTAGRITGMVVVPRRE